MCKEFFHYNKILSEVSLLLDNVWKKVQFDLNNQNVIMVIKINTQIHNDI